MANNERTCPSSGVTFTPKRSNQKFIDAKARCNYHNQKAKATRQAKKKFDQPLWRNYKILTELMDGKTELTVHREFLLGKGMAYTFFTHHVNKDGKSLPCYYNYMLSVLADKPDYVKIQKV